MNNKELVLQIPANNKEIIEISLGDTDKYVTNSQEVEAIKEKCVEISKNNQVRVLYLDF